MKQGIHHDPVHFSCFGGHVDRRNNRLHQGTPPTPVTSLAQPYRFPTQEVRQSSRDSITVARFLWSKLPNASAGVRDPAPSHLNTDLSALSAAPEQTRRRE